MTKKCTVPMQLALNAEGDPCYIECEEVAAHRVGGWLVCEKHKEHYTDKKGWPAEKLKEDE